MTLKQALAEGWTFSEQRDGRDGVWLTRYAATNRVDGVQKEVVAASPEQLLVAIEDTMALHVQAAGRDSDEWQARKDRQDADADALETAKADLHAKAAADLQAKALKAAGL